MPQLTQRERLIILALMVHQPPTNVTNGALAESYGLNIKRTERENLVGSGFIKADREIGGSRPFIHTLTSKGRERAMAELAGDADPKSPVNLRVVYAIFNAMHEFLRRNFLSVESVFSPEYLAGDGTEKVDESIAEELKLRYNALVEDDSPWVPLRSIREALPDIDRQVLDDALRALLARRIIELTPESNRRRITAADDDAALSVAGDKMHWLSIA